MCGIVGWANLNSHNSTTQDEQILLRRMCATLRHRGPDSDGFYTNENAALGMRRLAVIDVEGGEQPVYNEDRSVIAILNGEIYNFRELRKELERRGHKLNSHTDTEVLSHLYEEHGVDFLQYLNGMFAFALWDVKQRKLVLARDRFGEKPLYYGVFDHKLFFASELKALLAHPAIKPELDLEALRQYLAFDYVPAPLTIYQNIRKLPAAHFLVLKDGEIKVERYWQLSFKKQTPIPSVAEATETLTELLGNSVKAQLVADVPVGVLLSGGVDSSAVAAFAVQNSATKIKTFSIGFAESSFDESHYARRVAEHLGTEHYETVLSPARAAELITDVAGWLDEPLADPSIIPTFLLAKFVRQHVTVALGGDGGDELFAGYPMYRAVKYADAYNRLPAVLRQNVIEQIVRNLPISNQNLGFDYKARRFVRAANYDRAARHHIFFGSFAPHEQEYLLTDRVKQGNNIDVYADARRLLENCDADDEVEGMQFLDVNFYLAENILTKVDRASMRASLEVRAPFLDYRIAEYAASLPADYKLRGGNGKFILKKAVAGLVPDFVLKRRKKGFGIPVAAWLKNELRPLVRDLLRPERLKQAGLFEPQYVQKLLDEHEQGKANHNKLLWTLLVFELWRDNFGGK